MDNSTKLAAVNSFLTDLQLTSTKTTDNLALPNPTFNGKVALNVYQIYPKKLIYPLSACTINNTIPNAMLFANINNTIGIESFNISNTIDLTVRSSSMTTTFEVDVDYVDSSGNRSQLQIDQTYSFPAINVNRISFSADSVNNSISSSLNITCYELQQPFFIRNNISQNSNCGSAIITVPNGYVGVISDIYVRSAELGDILMYVKDIKNNLKTVQTFKNMSYYAAIYNSMGSFNYPLYAGESVYFGRGSSGMGEVYVHAIVTMTAI